MRKTLGSSILLVFFVVSPSGCDSSATTCPTHTTCSQCASDESGACLWCPVDGRCASVVVQNTACNVPGGRSILNPAQCGAGGTCGRRAVATPGTRCCGSNCCPRGQPYFCPGPGDSTYCFATELAAVQTCGSTNCTVCEATGATPSSQVCPPPSHVTTGCSGSLSLSCGDSTCCPAGFPFACGGRCYATIEEVRAQCTSSTCVECQSINGPGACVCAGRTCGPNVCGNGSCGTCPFGDQCGPFGICSSPPGPLCSAALPSSGRCPMGGVDCGPGNPCCPSTEPYLCAGRCYSTADDAAQACGRLNCVACVLRP